jgi:hypothetical protein
LQHVNTKKLAGASAVGAATAVTALLLGSTAAVAQEGPALDYAFGVAASGALTIDPLPYVESNDGGQVEDQLLGSGDVLGPEEDALAFGVLTTEARAGHAETSVAELNLLDLLRADLVRTYCDNGSGGLQIIAGEVLGRPLPENPVPSETIDLSPLLSLSLNNQVRHPNGSLTVTGIELSVLPAAHSLDDVVSGQERNALSNALGVPLSGGADTVREVVDEVTGTLGADLDLSDSLQTITIGAATCSAGEGHGDDGHGDDGHGDDGEENGDDNGTGNDGGNDDGGAGDGGSDQVAGANVPMAPAPEVMAANLPVTG